LARKHIVTKQFGEGAWAELFKDVATRFPYFAQPLLATSIIPLPEFISFHDELVRRFYAGRPESYFFLGEQSARWAVTEGPYKSFIDDKDLQALRQAGLKTVPVDARNRELWRKVVDGARIRGEFVPAQAYDDAIRFRDEYRKRGGK